MRFTCDSGAAWRETGLGKLEITTPSQNAIRKSFMVLAAPLRPTKHGIVAANRRNSSERSASENSGRDAKAGNIHFVNINGRAVKRKTGEERHPVSQSAHNGGRNYGDEEKESKEDVSHSARRVISPDAALLAADASAKGRERAGVSALFFVQSNRKSATHVECCWAAMNEDAPVRRAVARRADLADCDRAGAVSF